MIETILTRKEIRRNVEMVVLEHPEYGIKKVRLFGSYSPFTNNIPNGNSDVNIAIIEPKNIDVLALYDFEAKLSKALNKEVHAVRIEDAKEENEKLYNVIRNKGVDLS